MDLKPLPEVLNLDCFFIYTQKFAGCVIFGLKYITGENIILIIINLQDKKIWIKN
ncbi:MAG: hypothetical protein Athens071416_25 [Parcubacteria group bacterium Athens0714_16]|nr:MAG: hypothetical protein Athens071416_25 [Parcubacteria group bacterium Athens0714_16]